MPFLKNSDHNYKCDGCGKGYKNYPKWHNGAGTKTYCCCGCAEKDGHDWAGDEYKKRRIAKRVHALLREPQNFA